MVMNAFQPAIFKSILYDDCEKFVELVWYIVIKPFQAKRLASQLDEEFDRLFELALIVARLASIVAEVAESPVLEVWFAVIPAF